MREFGFVEMPDQEEAQAAINGLNGRELKGRSIIVNEGQPRLEVSEVMVSCVKAIQLIGGEPGRKFLHVTIGHFVT